MKQIIINKIEVTVIPSTNPTSSMKAIANVTLGPFKIKGFKILESQYPNNPIYVKPPSYRSKAGKFYDTFFSEDTELWEEIEQEIITGYNRRRENPDPEIPITEEKDNGGYVKHF
jgi:DNA-binding cell septation regulator SpoVG